MKAFKIIIILLILPWNAWAANYYVKTGGSGNGTSDAQAWGAISSVTNATLSPGDNVYFKCGDTFTGNLVQAESGTSGSRITFGAYYMDGSETVGVSGAKPILDDGDTIGATVYIQGAAYITITNLDVRQGETAIISSGIYTIIENSIIGAGSEFGVRFYQGGDYGIVRLNVIDSEIGTYGQVECTDGVQAAGSVAYPGTYVIGTQIYENVIDSWDHAMVMFLAVNYAEAYDNSLLNTDDTGGSPLEINAESSYNKFYRNYCDQIGDYLHFGGGDYNEVFNNILNGTNANTDITSDEGMVGWRSHSGSIIGNKFYNNAIYDSPGHGMFVYLNVSSDQLFHSNEITNNIFLTWAGTRGLVINSSGNANYGVNTWKNNFFYDGGSAVTIWRNSSILTVTQFNDLADGVEITTDNSDSDPEMNDPASGEFWAASGASAMVNAGLSSTGEDWDAGLDLASTWTPSISITTNLGANYGGRDIGAYELANVVYNVSPANGATGVSITASATWSSPFSTDDVFLKKASCPASCDTLVSDDDADNTYDMSTLDVSSTYCLGFQSDGGSGECQEFEFTTAAGPPVDPTAFGSLKHSSAAGELLHSSSAGEILAQ